VGAGQEQTDNINEVLNRARRDLVTDVLTDLNDRNLPLILQSGFGILSGG
jgi:hypothetical protein